MPSKRTILSMAAALLAIALLLPFLVNVNPFRGQIARALEATLGRPVEIRHVRLKLLSGPGFDLGQVSIAEDPAFGVEPLARMPALRATLRLRSLWTGRMAFSSLVFVEPSLNVVRNSEGRWNLESLLSRAAAGSRLRAALPYIELQDARINFKSGDTKSVFFLSGVHAALSAAPAAAPGPAQRRLHLWFTGSPARTDRMLTDVGRLRVEGWLGSGNSGTTGVGENVRLKMELSDAYLADLLVLVSGTERGIHGVLNVQADLEGEPAALRARGMARLRDLHRWDMFPPEGVSSLELRFDALLDGPARLLEVQKVEAALGAGKLEARGTVSSLFEHPAWKGQVRFSGARAGSVFRAVQNFSPQLSPALRLNGALSGELSLEGPPLAIRGFVVGRDLQLEDTQRGGDTRLRAPVVRFDLLGSRVVLQPTTLEVERARSLNLAGNWNWQTGSGEISGSGRDLPLSAVSAWVQATGYSALPTGSRLRDLPREGRLACNVRAEMARDAPARFTGWSQLARVRWTPAGLAAPVLLHAARLDFQPDQVRVSRIVASWGSATITGSVRFPLRPSPVYTADLRVNELDSAALATALRPAGATQGVATGAAAPPLFRAEGHLEVGRLRLRRLEVEAMEGAFRLAGRRLQLERAHGTFAHGLWTGSALIDFAPGGPVYQVNGHVRDVALATVAALSPGLEGIAAGQASGSVFVTSSGWDAVELLDNLNMRMRLEGRDLLLRNVDLEAAAAGQPSVSGGTSHFRSFTADLAVERRQVRLRRVLFEAPSATFQATGAVHFDHTADIEVLPLNHAPLSSFRLVGPLELPRAQAVEETPKVAAGNVP